MSEDAVIPSADDIEILPDGAPRSRRFDDIYASTWGAAGESSLIFVEGVELQRRLDGGSVTLGELGFGTGLNCLTTIAAAGLRSSRLRYLSYELYPLPKDLLAKVLSAYPELAAFAQELLDLYPESGTGFDGMIGGASVSVRFSDACEGIAVLPPHSVDGWYFDGFTPSKNPLLWNDSVVDAVTRASRRPAAIASYSVQGEFRRRLERFGWIVEKRPGFGKKKHSLRARLGY